MERFLHGKVHAGRQNGTKVMSRDRDLCSPALHRYVVGRLSMAQTLHLVCCEAVETIDRVEWAGTALRLERRPSVFASTDARIEHVQRIEQEMGVGPCLDAMRRGDVVRIGDTSVPGGPYRRFATAAAERGIMSVISVPLITVDVTVGALNLYAGRRQEFVDDDVPSLGGFAAEAAIVIANACAYWDVHSLKEHLVEAMATRATIEQAKGIIMGMNRCSAEQAFELLRMQSQHENIKVRDIASELVRRAGH